MPGKKSLRKESTIIRTDSTRREQTGLLQSAIQQRQASRLRSVTKKICLTLPDSLHRQYIHSVIFTETEQTTADTLSAIQQIISYKKEEETDREITAITEERNTRRLLPAGRPGFVILLLFIIYIFTKKQIMGYKLKTIERKVQFGKDAGQVKYYTRIENGAELDLEAIAREAAGTSGISAITFKMVIHLLAEVLIRHLREGRIIKLGDFGTFRLSVSSKAMEYENGNKRKAIRKIKIYFLPGKDFKKGMRPD